MDSTRLANVIFNRGQKITQVRYQTICESIDSDIFTLDEYVLDYKKKEQFMGKLAYKLNDGSKVLVSESTIKYINTLDINKTEVQEYMREGYENFKKLIDLISVTQ